MLKIVEAATVPAVSLPTAKAHLRIDHDLEDTLITLYQNAAADSCAHFAGLALQEATYQVNVPSWVAFTFPCGVPLPISPIRSIESVKYTDAAGAEQTIAAENYSFCEIDAGGWIQFLEPFEAPETKAGTDVVVRFVAGYDGEGVSDSALPVPSQAQAAILLTLGSLYANRENVVIGKTAIELPGGARILLSQIRIYR